jgi:hypothetical protein
VTAFFSINSRLIALEAWLRNNGSEREREDRAFRLAGWNDPPRWYVFMSSMTSMASLTFGFMGVRWVPFVLFLFFFFFLLLLFSSFS